MAALVATRTRFKILFLGQCIAAGHGVEADGSYPQLAQRALSAQFPALSFAVELRPLLHPVGLQALVKSVLPLRPDILVFSLPAAFTTFPWRVNALYLQAPAVLATARAFVRRIEARLRRDSAWAKLFSQKSFFRPTVVAPALSIAEYERLIVGAVDFCRRTSACRVVLMGPGGFNEYSQDGMIESVAQANAVNQMIVRVGERLRLPVINAHECMGEQRPEVYQPESHRWSQLGHQVMAREVASILAGQVKSLYQPVLLN